jgi:hypothetical protein
MLSMNGESLHPHLNGEPALEIKSQERQGREVYPVIGEQGAKATMLSMNGESLHPHLK